MTQKQRNEKHQEKKKEQVVNLKIQNQANEELMMQLQRDSVIADFLCTNKLKASKTIPTESKDGYNKLKQRARDCLNKHFKARAADGEAYSSDDQDCVQELIEVDATIQWYKKENEKLEEEMEQHQQEAGALFKKQQQRNDRLEEALSKAKQVMQEQQEELKQRDRDMKRYRNERNEARERLSTLQEKHKRLQQLSAAWSELVVCKESSRRNKMRENENNTIPQTKKSNLKVKRITTIKTIKQLYKKQTETIIEEQVEDPYNETEEDRRLLLEMSRK